jgi:hypothetical protein
MKSHEAFREVHILKPAPDVTQNVSLNAVLITSKRKRDRMPTVGYARVSSTGWPRPCRAA